MFRSVNICRCSLSNVFAFPFLFAAFVMVVASGSASDVFAQGKLGRVRQAVRRYDPPAASHTDHDHEDDDAHHADSHRGHDRPGSRPRRNRRAPRGRRGRRNGGGGASFLALAFQNDDCYSHVVHEHVHVIEPRPVLVQEPILVEETYFENESSPSDLDIYQTSIVDDNFSSWCGRLTATYGYDFEAVGQGSFGLLLQAPGSLGLDTSITMLRESGSTFRDHLWMGDVNLVYEVINSGDFRARAGIGVNWLGDRFGGEAGVNLTLGFDWQLNADWVLTGESDFGSIGDSDLFRGELSLGRQFGNAEWATGYRHTDIGGVSFGSVFTGFRFRF